MTAPAVVLLSGGLDSTVTLAECRAAGFTPYALTIRYGQRHATEILAAQRVAAALEAAQHLIFDVPLNAWGGSALTGPQDVPKHKTKLEARSSKLGKDIENPEFGVRSSEFGKDIAPETQDPEPETPSFQSEIRNPQSEIPITYVPARNTVFLSLALAWAETLDARDIFIGVNAIDYSGYPDCRPEFIAAFERLADLATKAGVQGARFKIHTPLITLTKAQIITRGAALGVDFSLTHSCYDPDAQGRSCGRCDSCRFRLKGFQEAGLTDPLPYQPYNDV